MFKFVGVIAFAALIICGLAGTTKFIPTYPNSVVSFNTSKPSESEVYFGYVTSETVIMQVYNAQDPSKYYVGRCDLADSDGNCLMIDTYGDSCKMSRRTVEKVHHNFIEEVFDTIEFDDTKYPKETDCPVAGQTGCMEYCDVDHDDYCVYADAEGYLFKKKNGETIRTYVYSDHVDPFAFVDHDCDGQFLPPPVNPYASSMIYTPKLDCADHFEVVPSNGDPRTTVYISQTSAAPNVKVVDADGTYTLYRGDIHDDDGKYYAQTTMQECHDEYVPLDELQDALAMFLDSLQCVDDGTYPRACDCPEGIQGECKMYCDYGFTCSVVNSNNKMVAKKKMNEEKFKIIYHDDHDPSVFATKTCNEATEIPAPADPCVTPKPSSTSVPGTSSVPSSASFIQVAFSAVLIATVLVALL